jgi:hypothetical protein
MCIEKIDGEMIEYLFDEVLNKSSDYEREVLTYKYVSIKEKQAYLISTKKL